MIVQVIQRPDTGAIVAICEDVATANAFIERYNEYYPLTCTQARVITAHDIAQDTKGVAA